MHRTKAPDESQITEQNSHLINSEITSQNFVPNLNLEFKPNSQIIDTKTHTIETNVQTPHDHFAQNLLEVHNETGIEEISINKQSFSVNPNKRGNHQAQGSEGYIGHDEGNFLQKFDKYTLDQDMKAQTSMM